MPQLNPQAETILVVDDDDIVRRALVRTLMRAGFKTLEASNGSDAVHLFAAHATVISAVTLDWAMPTTNGRETLAMLSEFAPSLPIIVVTAFPQPDNVIGRSPGSRGVGYVQKPFTSDELTGEIRRVIADIDTVS